MDPALPAAPGATWTVLAQQPAVVRRCLIVSALLIASGLVFGVVLLTGSRPLDGPLSWRKPATFGVSFGVTLAAVTWLSSYLRLTARTRAVLLTVFAVDCVVEVAGVTLQAVRDVPSHLNRSTPFNTVVAFTLAAGGAVLIVVLGRMAFLAIAGRTDAPPSMALALRAGFALLMAGLLSGAAMIARGTVAMQTSSAAHAYAVTGFLKGVHFVTLHGVLVLPIVAWLAGRTRLTEPQRTRVVALATVLYVVVTLVAVAISLVTAFD